MKLLNNLLKFPILCTLLTISNFSIACNPGQGSGQCGYYDNSGYHNAPIGSYSGNNYKQPTQIINRIIHLPSKFGAIASSQSESIIYPSSNMNSSTAAINEALRGCGRYASDCEIVAQVENGCLALAYGKFDNIHYVSSTGGGSTKDEARKNAINACHKFGGAGCKIIELSCSIPTPP
ncbi:DUF4189 domain-containing protein [Simonsiella muelleri]|uniref:DUF4189 domain-containing protein n=1 Tax=Simonsiella muelleri TaxID=72 RepID=UPI0023EFCAF9|nr:DUF4189 domain-containing protein [Simonsiella muelleri]